MAETNTQMQSNLSETKVMEEIWEEEEQLSKPSPTNHDSLPKQETDSKEEDANDGQNEMDTSASPQPPLVTEENNESDGSLSGHSGHDELEEEAPITVPQSFTDKAPKEESKEEKVPQKVPQEAPSTNENSQSQSLQYTQPLQLIEESKSAAFDSDHELLPIEDSPNDDIELLRKFRNMYDTYVSKIAEEESQRKASLRVGALVDIFSTSRDQWLPGHITQLKGDAVCIFYHRKIKWLHKNSKNYRAHVNDNEPPMFAPKLALTPSKSAPMLLVQEDECCAVENDNAMTPSLSAVTPSVSAVPPVSLSYPQSVDESSQHKHNILSPNTYQYEVRFNSAKLGMSFCSYKDGTNCMVHKCMSDYAKKAVNSGSIVVAINGKNVYGMPFTKISEMIKEKRMKPPMVITFKSMINGTNYKQINNVNERGTLQVKVLCGMQLKKPAKYVGVSMGKGRTRLNTKSVKKSDQNPNWHEVLVFSNFRCDHGKIAIVTVYDSSFVSKNKIVGTAELVLPVKFNKIGQHTLEISDEKGHISGVIRIDAIVTQ